MRKIILYSLISMIWLGTINNTIAQKPATSNNLEIIEKENRLILLISEMSNEGTITIFKAGGDIYNSTYKGLNIQLPTLPKGQNLILIKDSKGNMSTITFKID